MSQMSIAELQATIERLKLEAQVAVEAARAAKAEYAAVANKPKAIVEDGMVIITGPFKPKKMKVKTFLALRPVFEELYATLEA